MIKYICDNCGKEFNGPIDQVVHTDEHKVVRTFDLCASCRKDLKTKEDTPQKEFFKKLRGGN